MGRASKGMMTWGTARAVLVALVLLHASSAVMDEDAMTVLDAEGDQYDPSIQANRMHEVKAIQDFDSMQKYIQRRMAEVVKKQLSRTDDGAADEEIQIGDTIKKMEAKHAVEEQLNTEVKVDCEVAPWAKWGPCSKKCGGGMAKRKRIVTRKPRNGGVQCPKLENTLTCNEESCEEAHEDMLSKVRQITREEMMREKMASKVLKNQIKGMASYKGLMKNLRKYMKGVVHTKMAVMYQDGTKEKKPLSDEDTIKPLLTKALARNKVKQAESMYEKSSNSRSPA